MARAASFLAILLVALAASATYAQQANIGASALAAADSTSEHGRSILAAKKKPTRKATKKPTVKLYSGTKACGKFGAGCSVCTKSACTACSLNFVFKSKTKKCSCKTGYKLDTKTKTCKPVPKPTKKATRAPTKKPNGGKPVKTSPPLQKEVADPKIASARALKDTCSGPSAGGLKFTILPGLYAFADAAGACKDAGMKLSDIDVIFSSAKGQKLGDAAEATITKCVGTSRAVWFDTSLAAPQCNAFTVQPQPSDGAPSGRKLSAAAAVLLTQEVPTGCKTQLPVLCV